MARVQIPINFTYPQTVWVATSSGGAVTTSYSVDVPVSGATVSIVNRGTGSTPTVYSAETGSSTLGSLTTDSGGNVPGWVLEGSYTVSAASVGAFTGASQAWEAVRGDGVSNVASGVIGLGQLTSTVLQELVPTGTMLDFAAASPPAGYILCDGTAYSQSGTYAGLFAVIGTTWNTGGEAGGFFRVPDFRGLVSVGAGAGPTIGSVQPLTARTLGPRSTQTANATDLSHTVGGEEVHTQASLEAAINGGGYTAQENAAHQHGAPANGFVSYTGDPSIVQGYLAQSIYSTGYGVNATLGPETGIESALHAHQFVSSDHSGIAIDPMNNMQPFAVSTKIIKT